MAEDVTLRFRTAGVRKAQQAFEKIEQNADDLRRTAEKMRGVGKSLTVGLTLPLAAAGGAAAKMAADAEEAANKFEVVMGGSAAEVEARFESLTDTIPLTVSQMQKLSAGIQDLLVPMGVARSQAAGMSADFVKLAADLASFNNVPTDQALEAIKSALSGMSRPIRQFGVDVRKTRLEQLALTEGLIEQGEELDRTARAQAVMRAIVLDSEDAMGDAARTADSFRNQLRFLKRDLREVAEQIGQTLIPVLRPMIGHLSDLLNSIEAISPTLRAMIVGLTGAAAAAGPLMVVVSQMVIAFTDIVAIIAGAGGLMAALSVLAGPAGLAGLAATLAGGAGLIALFSNLAEEQSSVASATDQLRKNTDELRTSMSTLAKQEVRELLTSARLQLGQIRAQIAEIQSSQRFSRGGDETAGGRFGLGIGAVTKELGKSGDVAELKKQAGMLENRIRVLTEQVAGEAAGNAGEDAGERMAKGMHDGLIGALFGGEFDIASVFERQAERARRAFVESTGFQTIPGMGLGGRAAAATAGGTGVQQAARGLPASEMVNASQEAGASMQELVNVTLQGGEGMQRAAQTTVSAFGAMAQAAIRGSDQMATSLISGITQIVQSIPGVGGLAGAAIGAAGGILSAAFSGGGSNRPQPVEVTNDRVPVEEQNPRRPMDAVIQFIDSADPAQLEHDLRRRTRRDATERIPQGTSLAGGT